MSQVPLGKLVVLHKFSHQAVVLVLSEAVLVIGDPGILGLEVGDYEHRCAEHEHEYRQLSP